MYYMNPSRGAAMFNLFWGAESIAFACLYFFVLNEFWGINYWLLVI